VTPYYFSYYYIAFSILRWVCYELNLVLIIKWGRKYDDLYELIVNLVDFNKKLILQISLVLPLFSFYFPWIWPIFCGWMSSCGVFLLDLGLGNMAEWFLLGIRDHLLSEFVFLVQRTGLYSWAARVNKFGEFYRKSLKFDEFGPYRISKLATLLFMNSKYLKNKKYVKK
jgi:hypothetical protein